MEKADVSKYCRVCGSTKENLLAIYSHEGELWGIAEKISRCLPVIVMPTDQLPHNVCFSCLQKLDTCFELLNTAINADANLRTLFPGKARNCMDNALKLEDNAGTEEGEGDAKSSDEDGWWSPETKSEAEHKENCDSNEETKDCLMKPVMVRAEEGALLLGIEGPITCDLCGEDFTDMDVFDEHVLEHRGRPPWPCLLCDGAFETGAALLQHKTETHPQELVSCGSCSVTHDTLTPTRKRRVYECTKCRQHFDRQDEFYAHRKSHKRPATMECVTCHKVFTNERFYKRHRYIHDPEYWDRYKCSICQRPFRDAQALSNHMQLHSGIKPHMCDICGRTYNRFANMLKHRKQHKPPSQWEHRCQHCEACYERLKDLMVHIEKDHGLGEAENVDEKPNFRWICRYCGKRVSTKLSLQDHERIHTGVKPYVCEWCGRKFRSRPNLLQHHLTHTGDRRHACTVCGKRFSRKAFIAQHMRVHTGEKPFVCDVCGHRFTQAGDMRRHRRRHGELAERAGT